MNELKKNVTEEVAHIFLQMDTDKLIEKFGGTDPLAQPLADLKLAIKHNNNAEAKSCLEGMKETISQMEACSAIYKQGSMSSGSVINDFTLDVDTKSSIFFSILPTQLYSFHMLHFTYCEIHKEDESVYYEVEIPEHQLSFEINTKKHIGHYSYSLFGILSYLDAYKNPKSITVGIDPKLRIKQPE